MVVQEKVNFIVTLCKLEEGGISKCSKFWPEGGVDQAFAEELAVEGMTITLDKSEDLTDFLIRRIFTVRDKKEGIEVKVV